MKSESETKFDISDENDQIIKILLGCGSVITFLAGAFLTGLILFFLFGCSSQKPTILTDGNIIDRDGDSYLTLWKDAKKTDNYAIIWVFKQGYGLVPITDLDIEITITPRKPANHGRPNSNIISLNYINGSLLHSLQNSQKRTIPK